MNQLRNAVLKKFINSYKRKVPASSLVEVIVALTICMVIFLIAMSVILQSQKSNNVRLRQKALFLLSGIEITKLGKDSVVHDGSLRIEKITLTNDTLEGVSQVNVMVLDNLGHLLGQKVIWVKASQTSEDDLNLK